MWLVKTGKDKFKRIGKELAMSVYVGTNTKYRREDIWLLVILGHVATFEEIGEIANDPERAQIVVYSLGELLDTRHQEEIDNHPSENVSSTAFGVHPIKRSKVNSAYKWQEKGDFTIVSLYSTRRDLPIERFTQKNMRRNGLSLSEVEGFWLNTIIELSNPEAFEKPDEEIVIVSDDGEKEDLRLKSLEDETPEGHREGGKRRNAPKRYKAKQRREKGRYRRFTGEEGNEW